MFLEEWRDWWLMEYGVLQLESSLLQKEYLKRLFVTLDNDKSTVERILQV